jgi:asparaginyl-tRNA synthetase
VAEFWMIEPEMAFYDITDNMDLAEDFLKYLIAYTMEHCAEDLGFLNNMIDKGLLERLKFVLDHPFERKTYSEAIDILKKSGKKFEFPVELGTGPAGRTRTLPGGGAF